MGGRATLPANFSQLSRNSQTKPGEQPIRLSVGWRFVQRVVDQITSPDSSRVCQARARPRCASGFRCW